MPSKSRVDGKLRDNNRPDFILGDRFGQSCHPELMELATATLQNLGYNVTQNVPYAGGYITEHYGQLHKDIHSLQVEINRSLYMNESSLTLKPEHTKLAADLKVFVETIGKISLEPVKHAAS